MQAAMRARQDPLAIRIRIRLRSAARAAFEALLLRMVKPQKGNRGNQQPQPELHARLRCSTTSSTKRLPT